MTEEEEFIASSSQYESALNAAKPALVAIRKVYPSIGFSYFGERPDPIRNGLSDAQAIAMVHSKQAFVGLPSILASMDVQELEKLLIEHGLPANRTDDMTFNLSVMDKFGDPPQFWWKLHARSDKKTTVFDVCE